MRLISILMFGALAAYAAANDSPSGTRITPPTLREISPLGIPRGGAFEVTIVGYNLASAKSIYFSEPSIKARITRIRELSDQDDLRLGGNGTPLTVDLGPLPARNEITAEIDVASETPIGPVNFRVLTSLGLSPQGMLSIEPFYGESADKEPNDTPDTAVETLLPAILVGAISKPGDVDYFKIRAAAGEQIVLENNGRMLGSSLQPVITIYDESQNTLQQFTEDGAHRVNAFAHTFEKAGTYYIRISDYQESGSSRHFYRVMVGHLPVVLAAFPLGVQKGKTADIVLTGFNLAKPTIRVPGEVNEGEYDSRWVRPDGTSGSALSRARLAVGDEPELLAKTGEIAQTIPIPITINGRMTAGHQDFRFHARKAQKLVIEVNAARLGSPLDSQLEVLDAQGKPVERATVRSIQQTTTSLRDHASTDLGIRLDSQSGFRVGDYLMVGTEIVQISAMPRGPDDDFTMVNFNGLRVPFFDTTAEAHAMDTPAYKVQIHPAGAKFAPNGLPVVHLMYRNDDGGPGYGKDSRLHFTAPADGDYTVRLSDVRGLTGYDYAYRLTVREPHPDYQLSVNPRNPNVPAGGRIPLTVTALRLDDFDGPIPVKVKDLPAGMHASDAVILRGQKSTTVILSADSNASLDAAVPLKVMGGNGREADGDDRMKLIALMPRADVDVAAETHEIVIEPGGRATLEIAVSRNNGFAGRVPLNVRNLPPTVRVTDVGLNGVLVNETETKRTFTLEALPDADPIDQDIYVSGDIETRAGMQQTAFSTERIVLKIRKKNSQIASK